jgi:hypothetical protein
MMPIAKAKGFLDPLIGNHQQCKVRRPAGEKRDYIDLVKKPTGAAHLRNLI